ncbi:O-antigen ligase family protein [Sphingomonas jatrophae]|uniref:O-antigen ligase n=1 Tax=Sphingomonas jatrophae TaxID=1166337 RepID=A0A1I6M5K0_9SPHN|nr:O-antigen ligase family protein [Sphingomonas jatrophae]SFS10984.1 O-antigen ligase [Sphingomonas jatrophae]
MTTSSEPRTFRLPRVSRLATRQRDTAPGWSLHLATLTFAALLVLAFLGPWMAENNDGVQSQIRTAGYVLLAALTIVAIRPWRHPERLLVIPWPLVLALGWCALSLTWAFAPDVGLRRLALTVTVAWSLFALVRHLGIERALLTLSIVLAAALAVNYAFVLLYPSIGLHAPSGEFSGKWRGLMAHKNFAGELCAYTVLVFAFNEDLHKAARIAVAAAAGMFLLMTDSETSLKMGVAALVFGGILYLFARKFGRRQLAPPAAAWVLFAILAVIAISMALNPSYYLQMVSDPAAFTGRTQIWTALIKVYADQPLTGVGYGSLWDLGPNGPINNYATDWVTEQSEGHNGYFDMLAQIGGPGTLIVLFATLVWPVQRLLRGGDHPARALAGAILLFCLGHNFTESTMLDRDALSEVFLILAIALLWNATGMSVSAPSELLRRSTGRRSGAA